MVRRVIHISVVVPFYNSERYISECIESLLSQKYPMENYEIIMVDNNSTDASADIVRRYSQVKLVSEKRQGAYAARNRGLKEAKGEVIAFTDPDCVPSSDWLKEIELAMADSDVGVVVGSHQLARDSFLLSILADYENEKKNYVFNNKIKETYYGHTNNMAVRKKLFDEMGLFIERSRGADTIFVCQCIELYSSDVIRYSPTVQVRHMEIDNVGTYFGKVSVYGSSSQKYRDIVCSRPLTNWERFIVFRRTVQSRRYSWIKSSFLLGLLAAGLVYWLLGNIIGDAVE
ncbi:MAG: glycosyltransferase [Ignavibacteriales bacterium]